VAASRGWEGELLSISPQLAGLRLCLNQGVALDGLPVNRELYWKGRAVNGNSAVDGSVAGQVQPLSGSERRNVNEAPYTALRNTEIPAELQEAARAKIQEIMTARAKGCPYRPLREWNRFCDRPLLDGSNFCFWHTQDKAKYEPKVMEKYFGDSRTLRQAVEKEVAQGASLSGAYLSEAPLGGNWFEPGANLAGAHLDFANLSGTHLSYGSLKGAVLVGCNLESAYLSEVDLQGANFSFENL